jgi:hypothetical protein
MCKPAFGVAYAARVAAARWPMLIQAAKRRARGFTRIAKIRTVIFLIAGRLDFQAINPHAGHPT